ncbi:MAG: hypothetical protein H0V65_07605 [Chitinophagales bacterium]|nr:hypothetical protein [Chitinophagales bacterium]
MLKSDGIQVLYAQDLILFPVYLLVIILLAFLYRNIAYRNIPSGNYFLPALAIKILGGLAMGTVYIYYYNGGDTFYYYYDAETFNKAIQNSFDLFVKLLFLPAKTVTMSTYESTRWLVYFNDSSGWTADKVYGILSVLSFHSYPVMTLLTAALSFTGAWALYRTFTDLYPGMHKQFALVILFVPSVFFWGSGILKDSITFGCLGWMTYSSYLILFKKTKLIKNSITFLCTSFLAIQIKPYIVISFLPALIFWIFFTYRSRINNRFVRVVLGPAIFIISLISGYLLVLRLGEEYSKYSLQTVMETVEDFHRWHAYLAENANASGYSFGEFNGKWTGLISKIPAAINVTLFRPYLWEVNNIVMMAAAIESAFILAFTLYILIRNGIRRTVTSVFTNPALFFCLFFSLVFAFAVGFSSYNFGALVRYKIPCIPFFLAGLIILNYETTLKRKKSVAEKELSRKRNLDLIHKRKVIAED